MNKHRSLVTSTSLVGLFTALIAVAPACSGNNNGSGFGGGGSGSGGSGSGSSGSGSSGSGSGSGTPILTLGDGGEQVPAGDGGCVGLQCQIHSCTGSTNGTTMTGHVYDPAGNNPLYDVVVYVPNGTPAPITSGIDASSCSCDDLYTGEPIASAVTDASGSFTINHVPDGTNIPLVVQIGKWRTQLKIPTVSECAPNDLDTLLPSKLTLPSKAGISTTPGPTMGLEQDIPNIAVSTGKADTLECLLSRVGVDQSEYTSGPGGTGHIHIFVGGGGGAPSMAGSSVTSDSGLWTSYDQLKSYDIVLLSCEGSPTSISNIPGSTAAMQTYTTAGGRVFAEHYHYQWFTGTGSVFANDNLAAWSTGGGGGFGGGDSYTGTVNAVIQTTLPSGAAFPKGQALQTWLDTTVGAETGGQLPIAVGRHDATVSSANISTPWAQTASGVSPASTQYFSFDTPVGGIANTDGGAPNYCGRIVYSDLHVSGGGGGGGGGTGEDSAEGSGSCPTGCTAGKLQPDEDALEFMLFDLSSCVTPVTAIPQPPVTPPPPIK